MIRVGIGGWIYEPWRGLFFPEKLTKKAKSCFMPADASPELKSTEFLQHLHASHLQPTSQKHRVAAEEPPHV